MQTTMRILLVLLLSFSHCGWASAEEKGVDGVWRWTYKTRDGKDAEAAVRLKREGDKLTGAYLARDGKETPIENGTVAGDTITFEVTREIGGNKMLFKYSGKIMGDAITGKIMFGKDKPTPHEWEAKRAEK